MAEPLVLLPGMMCDARLFRVQTELLCVDTTIILGCVTRGERIEEIASGLLDELPNRFALAGFGLGGIVGMEILRRAPDRMTRLALMGANPLAETPQIAAAREAEIVQVKTGRIEDVLRARIPLNSLAPSSKRNEIISLMVDMADELGEEVFLRQSRALQRRRDQQGTLRKSHIPTLVLCGAHDPINSVKRSRFLSELIPNAELCVIEEAGYLPTLEQAEEVTDALRDWLRRPASAR